MKKTILLIASLSISKCALLGIEHVPIRVMHLKCFAGGITQIDKDVVELATTASGKLKVFKNADGSPGVYSTDLPCIIEDQGKFIR